MTERQRARKGDGAIQKIEDIKGKKGMARWSLRFWVRPEIGQRRRLTRTFVGTETQARAELRRLQAELTIQGVTDANVMFFPLVREFLTRMKLRVSEGSLRRYEGVVIRHIQPRWGQARLKDVDFGAVEDWYNRLRQPMGSRGGYSRTTIGHIHTVMRGTLILAKRRKLLPTNPLEGLVIEATHDEKVARLDKRRSLTPDEAQRWLKAAEDDRTAAPLVFCLLTGLRIGETLALRWAWVDLVNGEVEVRGTRSGGDRGGVYESPGKSKSARRMIYLSGSALAWLQRQDRRRHEEVPRLGGVEPEYVFFTERGTPYRPDGVRRAMDRVCRNAGVPRITTHELRHSLATLQLAGGKDLVALSKHLGHSRVSITLDYYGHALPEKRRGLTLELGEEPLG